MKPPGFKKKAYKFYLQRTESGQIINIQKSTWYAKDHKNMHLDILKWPMCKRIIGNAKDPSLPVLPMPIPIRPIPGPSARQIIAMLEFIPDAKIRYGAGSAIGTAHCLPSLPVPPIPVYNYKK
ncbi:DUF4304 domain-containing protein [Niabella drilacis]|uniref:DUF4304 domain-containing protein n=1 Tax=Niabella drilacis (strain DSM 25811 / CCM 8410 / CCUG 62505 / LMG 26954 / E90) TaxID=1285928 RepID=UPI000B894369